jgi:hypothetical protein
MSDDRTTVRPFRDTPPAPRLADDEATARPARGRRRSPADREAPTSDRQSVEPARIDQTTGEPAGPPVRKAGPTGPAPTTELRGDPEASDPEAGVTGGAAGGAIVGTAVAGPLGGMVGAAVGSAVGGAGEATDDDRGEAGTAAESVDERPSPPAEHSS